MLQQTHTSLDFNKNTENLYDSWAEHTSINISALPMMASQFMLNRCTDKTLLQMTEDALKGLVSFEQLQKTITQVEEKNAIDLAPLISNRMMDKMQKWLETAIHSKQQQVSLVIWFENKILASFLHTPNRCAVHAVATVLNMYAMRDLTRQYH